MTKTEYIAAIGADLTAANALCAELRTLRNFKKIAKTIPDADKMVAFDVMDKAITSKEGELQKLRSALGKNRRIVKKLEEIEAATSGNVAENQEYHNILALLTRTVPELADYIELENNAIEGGTEALRQHTEAWKKDAEAQAYQEYINALYDQYGEVMAESAENSIKLTQAQIKLETAEKNRDAALERMNELSQEAYENGEFLSQEYYQLENALYGYNDEIYTAQREIDNLNKAIDKDAEAVAAAEAEIESAQEAVEQLTGVTEEQTEAEAEAAGADFTGGEELIPKIQKEGWLDFDVVVATPDMMGIVGRLGKILGPKGLMPNPKAGTVTMDVTKAINDIKAGKIEYRLDKSNIIHVPIGKASFDNTKLQENFDALMEAIVKARPSALKGQYLRNITITSTMGPGVKVSTAKF